MLHGRARERNSRKSLLDYENGNFASDLSQVREGRQLYMLRPDVGRSVFPKVRFVNETRPNFGPLLVEIFFFFFSIRGNGNLAIYNLRKLGRKSLVIREKCTLHKSLYLKWYFLYDISLAI